MKTTITVFFTSFLLLLFLSCAFAEVKIIALSGSVHIRRGIEENWTKAALGDALKPEDSIELGKKSSATLLVDGKTKIFLAEESIVDVSDLRSLTQDDLLLLLAMESVRSVPERPSLDEGMPTQQTTTIHGASRDESPPETIPDKESGSKTLRGTKTLYDNGYYATCILKVKAVYRLCPDLKAAIDTRIMVADAMEKMNVRNEALNEYVSLKTEKLSDSQKKLVEQKINILSK